MDVDVNAIPEAAAATINELKRNCWFLVAVMICLGAVGTLSLYTEKKAMFNFGYATGFNDGKAGAKPKQETNWDRVMRCHNRDARFPAPDDVCYDTPPKKLKVPTQRGGGKLIPFLKIAGRQIYCLYFENSGKS